MGRRATTSGARAARTSTATAPRRTTTTLRVHLREARCVWATTSIKAVSSAPPTSRARRPSSSTAEPRFSDLPQRTAGREPRPRVPADARSGRRRPALRSAQKYAGATPAPPKPPMLVGGLGRHGGRVFGGDAFVQQDDTMLYDEVLEVPERRFDAGGFAPPPRFSRVEGPPPPRARCRALRPALRRPPPTTWSTSGAAAAAAAARGRRRGRGGGGGRRPRGRGGRCCRFSIPSRLLRRCASRRSRWPCWRWARRGAASASARSSRRSRPTTRRC